MKTSILGTMLDRMASQGTNIGSYWSFRLVGSILGGEKAILPLSHSLQHRNILGVQICTNAGSDTQIYNDVGRTEDPFIPWLSAGIVVRWLFFPNK